MAFRTVEIDWMPQSRAQWATFAAARREAARPEPAQGKSLPAVIVADLTQTPRAAVSADPHELPTIQIDEVALATAERNRFDISADRTAAPRTMRDGPLSKPLRDQPDRRKASLLKWTDARILTEAESEVAASGYRDRYHAAPG